MFRHNWDKLAKRNSQEYMKDVHPEARRLSEALKKLAQKKKKPTRYRTGFDRANHIPLEQPLSNFSDGSRILF